MVRIRRRFALIICGSCMLIFLSLYVLLNYAAPDERKPNFDMLESKLEQLENGLQQHGEEMKNLKMRLEKNTQRSKNRDSAQKPGGLMASRDDGGDTGNVCPDVVQDVPANDIQMLDLYEKMSFVDKDGGVWKQGWNIKYDPLKYNSHHKLKVFVVPHSHNDPGWIQTFEEYYQHDTKHILSNALRHLHENPEMKFIWAETSYFARFYDELGESKRQQMKQLISNGQLEFVSGGWVMTDEANSHWRNMLLQLTVGQSWLKENFNITPTSSWSIDPFGYSPTMSYILKKSGFQNMLIQRTHYSVKKELAQQRQLEFYWRQTWDSTGSSAIFTHMMPFYSYDIPHTCGPDPKICCQFDFKRMGGFGLSCPWRVPPRAIDDNNVAARSDMLVDQWKKKAELYRTNVLFVPLGDDFRFKQSTEWEVQRVNYEKLFEHINAQSHFHVEAKFGTLQEYFDEVHRQPMQQFPNLSGDFFTYADRADNYWSGYFTSRPFHKRMDRLLMHYVHAADILHSWHTWDQAAGFDKKLEQARRDLSLFQHHDGITGTAKTHVMHDYEQRMIEAIKSCRFIMQQAVYRLLTKPSIYIPDYNFYYFQLDDTRWPGPDDSRTTIILGSELPTKHVVLHNTLAQWREELVEFYVSSPFITVTDFAGNPVAAQVTPVWSWHHDQLSNTIHPQGSSTKYRLLFKVKVPPLGLITYIIQYEEGDTKLAFTTFATNLILSTNPISMQLGDYPKDVQFGEHRETSLHVGDGPTVAFTPYGLLKSIQISPVMPHTPLNLKFFKYGTRTQGEYSGAYIFLPNGPARAFMYKQTPVVLISEGPLESSVTVGLPFVVHQTILRGDAPEIQNYVDIGNMDNTEIVMRLSTQIDNDDVFYTDLNGLQMIKRKRLAKLPLQANYYPVPSAIYIEDADTRLTVLSAQPLGGSSLSSGEIEIMQDRRLAYDDQRGLGQGVLDNKIVRHIFRVVVEKISSCTRGSESHPAGYLTSAAKKASNAILEPLDKFIFAENTWTGGLASFGAERTSANEELELITVRRLAKSTERIHHTGYVLHRTNLLKCGKSDNDANDDQFDVCNLLTDTNHQLTSCHRSTLTFLQKLEKVESSHGHELCPMESAAFIATHSRTHS